MLYKISRFHCKTISKFIGQMSPKRSYIAAFTPRRALLYVPGSEEKKLEKCVQIGADCIALDCEDGVAQSRKVQARLNIRNFLEKGKPVKCTSEIGVRVNSLESELLEEDLSVIVTGKFLPDSIVLPKIHKPSDLELFSEILNKFLPERRGIKLNLIIGVESATSLINLPAICEKAYCLAESNIFHPVALFFGSDDFCATIGAARTDEGAEILYARQKIVTVAKAFNMQAIDRVHIKFKDLDLLRKDSEFGASLGYTGKQVIHPNQVEVVHNSFLPSKEKINWAQGLIKEFHKHQDSGSGAFVFNDQMIDMPTLKQAQNIVHLVNAVMIRQ